MANTIHGTKAPENAGGSKAEPASPISGPADEHQPSCFALEEEREGWKGSGAAKAEINEAKPSL